MNHTPLEPGDLSELMTLVDVAKLCRVSIDSARRWTRPNRENPEAPVLETWPINGKAKGTTPAAICRFLNARAQQSAGDMPPRVLRIGEQLQAKAHADATNGLAEIGLIERRSREAVQ